MWRRRRRRLWSINSQHIVAFGERVRCARMHSSLTWRWWSQNIELFIRFMTISWTSLTSQPNRFQRPQRPLRYTLHASAHVPVVMRMETTKTPSLIEYSAIPTSARRKTTTKFIYFIFYSLEHVSVIMSRLFSPMMVKLKLFTHSIEHSIQCRISSHTQVHFHRHATGNFFNYVLNYSECQHLRATEWKWRRVPSVFVVQLKLHCSLHKKHVVLRLRTPSTHIKSKI